MSDSEHSPETAAPADEPAGPRAPDRIHGYLSVAGVFLGLCAVGSVLVGLVRPTPVVAPARRRGQEWSDLLLVGLATHRLSRLLTKDRVTTPLRAPFTEYEGPGAPGEVNERPVGTGIRRSVAELLSCPFCISVWVATAASFGLHLAPRPTRFVLTTAGAVSIADTLQYVSTGLEQRTEG
jgi:hypothetical protein